MNLVDPIQVWENDLPMTHADGSIGNYPYLAYRDAEDCAGYYGYGNTPFEATEDFLYQEAEAICSNCAEPCNTDESGKYADSCIMIEPNLSAWVKKWMEEDDTSHRTWRELNDLP